MKNVDKLKEAANLLVDYVSETKNLDSITRMVIENTATLLYNLAMRIEYQ